MAEIDPDTDGSAGRIAEFLKVLRSETMMAFVKEVTGLEFTGKAASLSCRSTSEAYLPIDPRSTMWIYRLTTGCYTVLGDEDAEQAVKDGISIDFWVGLSMSLTLRVR